jgi:hypothetical protein
MPFELGSLAALTISGGAAMGCGLAAGVVGDVLHELEHPQYDNGGQPPERVSHEVEGAIEAGRRFRVLLRHVYIERQGAALLTLFLDDILNDLHAVPGVEARLAVQAFIDRTQGHDTQRLPADLAAALNEQVLTDIQAVAGQTRRAWFELGGHLEDLVAFASQGAASAVEQLLPSLPIQQRTRDRLLRLLDEISAFASGNDVEEDPLGMSEPYHRALAAMLA